MMVLMHQDSFQVLVGQRFTCVLGGDLQLDFNQMENWPWRSGIIRAASHKDVNCAELKVCVEFEDEPWEKRVWIEVYGADVQMFLVEHSLVIADRKCPSNPSMSVLCPAMQYKVIVSKTSMEPMTCIQFLGDRHKAFMNKDVVKALRDRESLKQFMQGNRTFNKSFQELIRRSVDENRILQGAKNLVGSSIRVYSMSEGCQWFSASVMNSSLTHRTLEIKCEQVPNLKIIDPALIHVELVHNYADRVFVPPMKRPSEGGTAKVNAKQSRVAKAPVKASVKASAKKPNFLTYSRDDGKTLVVVDNPKSSGNSLLNFMKTPPESGKVDQTTTSSPSSKQSVPVGFGEALLGCTASTPSSQNQTSRATPPQANSPPSFGAATPPGKCSQNLPSETSSILNGDGKGEEKNLFLSAAMSQGKGLGFGLTDKSTGGFSSWASHANGDDGPKSENLFAAFTKPSTVFPKGFEFSVERFPDKNTLTVKDSPRLGSSEACKSLARQPASVFGQAPATQTKPAAHLPPVKNEFKARPLNFPVQNASKMEITPHKSPIKNDGVTYPRSILLDPQKLKRLQASGDCFVQDGSCNDIAPHLHKCRECRLDRFGRSKEQRDAAVFCRFFHFRRLYFNKHGLLREGGFLTPNKYDAEAINLWLPLVNSVVDLDLDTAKYILANIGDHFCKLVMSEKEVMATVDPQKQVAWKRAVRGVREMCDVCDTTIFNLHFVCPKCGFGVCVDCHRMKKKSMNNEGVETFAWLKCCKGQLHEPDNLMPTQIVPGKALYDVGDVVHSVRGKWGIKSNCPCSNKHQKPLPRPAVKEEPKQSSSSSDPSDGSPQPSKLPTQDPLSGSSKAPSSSLSGPLSWLTNLPNTNVNKENKDNLFTSALKTENKALPSFASFGKPASALQPFSSSILSPMSSNSSGFLRNLLNSSSVKPEGGEKSTPKLLDDIFASLVQTKPPSDPVKVSHGLAVQPSLMGFNTPHYWLCDNRLLCLQDPTNKSNWNVFRECWKQGQPVMVSGVHQKLNTDLWRPESFRNEFGDQEADLVNCRTNDIITGATVGDFWEGFEDISKRIKNDAGDPMVLKLKDWPPGEDFRDMMLSRFDDLMKNIPLPEYTRREGKLNLAARLPTYFVRPDLGPKMYNAYGETLLDF
ncbi:hypothetical protein GDO78_020118 [Eleutherodactylus coqui]|uniref:Lysine-specific demethylase n=1 Tax=Eleutherodactylus coqui TaxID=57060 RepID=A0A8J6EIM7_ELECQ|nr:hypothetical protein GDO78_020118 [Eleutherodactylus coqui]